MAIYPIVLAGGSGTRLWPVSRTNHPKQFLDLLGVGETLLQSTIKRAQACTGQTPFVIANKEHRFIVQQQIQTFGMSVEHILLEPEAKNTTGAIALACLHVLQQDPDAMLLIQPSDHFIPDTLALKEKILGFAQSLTKEEIGLFGVKPEFPATQYGYIEFSEGFESSVKSFIEKPSESVAEKLYLQNDVAWNSGMVLGSADTILKAIQLHEPILSRLVESSVKNRSKLYDFNMAGEAFCKIKSLSFDVAVLEKMSNLKLCLLEQEWDDLGSWRSLLSRRKSSVSENFNVFGSGETVVALGCDDIVLVKNDDVLFVAHQDKLDDMSEVSNYLHKHNLTHLLGCIDVHRPWGQFKILAQDAHFIVKRLIINPFSQISLQSHQFRREHWVVVKGEAQVQLEGELTLLKVGDSICVEKGQKHRLKNLTPHSLEVIEVQSGEVLHEDDIIRYDDEYERHKHH